MFPSRLLAAIVLAAPLVAIAQQAPKKAPQQPFQETSARGCSRIFYWGGDGNGHSGGQLVVDYGQPIWKEEYDKSVESMLGVRWRLGQNSWTRLDVNMDVNAGDVDVPAGLYYLVLERKQEDKSFVLWLLDPIEIRDAKIDAFEAAKTKGGIAVPLEYKAAELKADKLQIALTLDSQRKDGTNLVIHFGKHQLSAKLTLHPTRD
jgi:hypothetical protein